MERAAEARENVIEESGSPASFAILPILFSLFRLSGPLSGSSAVKSYLPSRRRPLNLLVGVVGAADERTRFDVAKAQRLAFDLDLGELGRSDVANDG